jgi:hypothetical protein
MDLFQEHLQETAENQCFFFLNGVSCIKFAHHAVLGIRFMLVDMMIGTFHFRELVISSRSYHHQFWELIN